MTDKILDHVKTCVDIASIDDTVYDSRLLEDINHAIAELSQLISLPSDFVEADSNTTFNDIDKRYSEAGVKLLIRRYITTSVRLTFDPPVGSVLDVLKNSLLTTSNRLTLHTPTESSK